MDLDDLTDGVNPFNRYTWNGRLVSINGTDTTDFTKEDVAEVVADYSSGDQWDGSVAAILKLKDGRFVTYETFYGPTGNGFSEDAYGGDADIHFASTYEDAVRWGLTDEGRTHLGFPQPEGERRTDDD